MNDWKTRLSEYDRQLISDAESQMNFCVDTVEFPFRTIDMATTIDFSFRPPATRSENYMVAKHFISEVYQGNRPARILDVGATPMLLKYHLATNGGSDLATRIHLALKGGEASLKYPAAAHLSRLEGVRVCATDIEKPLEIVDWLGSAFVLGDFREPKTAEIIVDSLGGRPDIVMGEFVFVEDLKRFQIETKNPIPGMVDKLGEEMTTTAWNLLAGNGYMIVNNGKGGELKAEDSYMWADHGKSELFSRNYLPEPLKRKIMSHFYWDFFTQIFQKKPNRS